MARTRGPKRSATARVRAAARIFSWLGLSLGAAWGVQSCRFPDDSFSCSRDAQCTDGVRGVCEQDHRCSYEDGTCSSGRRYGSSASGGCVSPDGGTDVPDGASGSGGASGGNAAGAGGTSSGGSHYSGGGGTAVSGTGGVDGGTGGAGGDRNPDSGPPGKELTLFAGAIGGKGAQDGKGALARFGSPGCLSYDGSRYLYTADAYSDTIRRIDTVTAEVATIAGYPFGNDYSSGTGADAHFTTPECVLYDGSSGTSPVLYVSEWDGNRIRQIDLRPGTSYGATVLVAGSTSGMSGLLDGTGAAAKFSAPEGLARGKGSVLYVADAYNQAIRAIDLGTGAVTTIAGDPAGPTAGSDDGPGASARFSIPHGLAYDPVKDRLFISEMQGERVRVLDVTTNTVSTLVTGTSGIAALYYDAPNDRLFASVNTDQKVIVIDVAKKSFTPLAGSGDWDEVDGDPAAAAFRDPFGVVQTATNVLYVADQGGPTLRKLVADGDGVYRTTTFAGLAAEQARVDGKGGDARFYDPGDMVLAPDDRTLYVSDEGNCAIRAIDLSTKQVSTFAGGAACKSVDGTGVTAEFDGSGAMTAGVTTAGGKPPLFVAEAGGVIRRIDTATANVTSLNAAEMDAPRWRSLAATATTIYASDEYGHRIVQLPVTGGTVVSFAGTGDYGCDDAIAASATFGRPGGVLWDGAHALYVADQACQKIRRVDLTAKTVDTVAGGGSGSDPDGLGKAARFGFPASLSWDRKKTGFYVQDVHTVRHVDATTFEVTTVVGDPEGAGAVWLSPLTPELNFPGGMVEGLDGELYLTSENAIVRWGGHP